MRINNVKHLNIQPMDDKKVKANMSNDLIGFFTELKTCSSIEQGINSFDDLAKQREIEARKPFKYKG